jgi:hypothetical protein
MKPVRPKQLVRPTQVVPADLCNSLLDSIGEMFYPDRAKTPGERKRWGMDKHWYRQRVITWAAKWLDSKAVTLPPDRFKKLILDKLSDIKRNTAQEVGNWPRYILKCFQDHFRHNGEAIYIEAKSWRNQLDAAMDRARAAGSAPPEGVDPIRVLALAHQVNKPAKKRVAKSDDQPMLF